MDILKKVSGKTTNSFNQINMKILLILFVLLFSSSVMADVDDVYYCSETLRYGLNVGDEDITQYKPQKFKFKRTNNKLIFGNEDNWYKDTELDIVFSKLELFSASADTLDIFKYEDGNFNYSATSYSKIRAVTGTCSLF